MDERRSASEQPTHPPRGRDRGRRHRPRGHRRGARRRSRRGRPPRRPLSYDLGAARYLRDGFVLDDATLEELRGFDAIMLGAVGPAIGDTRIPGGVLERGLLLRMRFGLDLYINYRPFRGVDGSLAEGCEFAIVRENTEGPYAGEGGVLRCGTPTRGRDPGFGEHALRRRALRALRLRARERARRQEGRRWCTRPTCSPSPATCGRRVVAEVGAEFPEVERRLPPRGRRVHLPRRETRSATASS